MSFSIQKANLWKRISAFLFDIILTVSLVVGFSAVFSVAFGYSAQTEKLETHYAVYEQEYGVDFDISEEDYEKLTQAEKDNFQAAKQAISKDEEIVGLYSVLFYMTLAIISLSCFCGILLWYFLIPLFFKNGQTLGKKIFGTAVIRTSGVKATQPVLFIRSMVGIFAIETMFPLLMLVMIYFGLLGFVGTLTILLLLILEIGVMIGTKTNSAIHDLLCDTVVVDLASQLIFDTEEELIAYKQEEQRQNVLNSRN